MLASRLSLFLQSLLSLSLVPILVFFQALAWENNSTIELVRQSTVTASNHYHAYDEFAENGELSGKRSRNGRISKTEPNIATASELVKK
jgi:hypothetical protein